MKKLDLICAVSAVLCCNACTSDFMIATVESVSSQPAGNVISVAEKPAPYSIVRADPVKPGSDADGGAVLMVSEQKPTGDTVVGK